MNKKNCISTRMSKKNLMLCLFAVSALFSEHFFAQENTKTFTIITGAHKYNLNPQTASYNTEAQILTGLYEGLFSYDPVTLEPRYAVASDYRISRDNRRWTFTIRPDAKFSDGTAITAEDVRTSWLKLIKEPAAPYSSLFDIVKGAKDLRTGSGSEENVGIYAADESTLSVHLTSPASHLPRLLCMSSFAVISSSQDVYSGPFVLAERTDYQIVLKKNTNYYDCDNTGLDQITFLLSDSNSENAYMFNTGLADWISGPVDLSKTISKDTAHITAEFATEYFFFKIRGNIWKNVRFRQALLEAVPWDKLRSNTFVPATTLVYPLNGYQKVQGYVYTDKNEALSLMEQARSGDSIGTNETLELVMAITESDYMRKQAEILREAWAPLGVELKTLEISSDEYLYEINGTPADIFSYTWIGDFADPLAFLELFRKDSTLNVSNWSNKEYDDLLNEANLYTDERHNSALRKAEQILLDEAIILPVQHPVSLNVIDLNAVGGWAPNSFDIHPLKYIFKKNTKPDVPNLVIR